MRLMPDMPVSVRPERRWNGTASAPAPGDAGAAATSSRRGGRAARLSADCPDGLRAGDAPPVWLFLDHDCADAFFVTRSSSASVLSLGLGEPGDASAPPAPASVARFDFDDFELRDTLIASARLGELRLPSSSEKPGRCDKSLRC